MKLRKNKTGTRLCPCCSHVIKKDVKRCTTRRRRREAKVEIVKYADPNNYKDYVK